MSQNINLLSELNITPITILNSKLMALIIVAWVLALILVYSIALGIHSGRKQELAILENTQKALLSETGAYREVLASFFPGITPTDLNKLPTSSRNVSGFYNYLKDLAAHTPRGVWLTRISLSEIDGSFIIEGSTVASSGVSALIDALGKTSSFNNKNFNTISMEKTPDTTISFSVSNIDSNYNTTKKTPSKQPEDKIRETTIK